MDYRELFVDESLSLLGALQALDATAKKTLFVSDAGGGLRAAVTDGDIRRFLLKGGSMEAPVREFANYSPKYIRAHQVKEAKAYMRRHELLVAPVVDEDRRVVGVVQNDGAEILSARMREPLPVVINAGGKGTRLYPYTKILPKPLIPVGELPIAEIIINRFCAIGCSQFHMIVNHKGTMIKSYFSETPHDYQLWFADEGRPLGTGGGLSLLRDRIQGTFIFTNCDTIVEADFGEILRMHRESGNSITMVCALKNYTVPYGVVEMGEGGAISGFKEKPSLSFFTNTGCYLVEPDVVRRMAPGEEIGFPTVVLREKELGNRVGIYPVSEYTWLDMGQFDSLDQMKERLGIHD